MASPIEVFADITCPFTHVGLKQVVRHVAEMDDPADIVVRAWPLEWVNGAPLDVDAVMIKAHALDEQLGVHDFSGLRADRWPATDPGPAVAPTGTQTPATGGCPKRLSRCRLGGVQRSVGLASCAGETVIEKAVSAAERRPSDTAMTIPANVPV